jgi:hypothetical protein
MTDVFFSIQRLLIIVIFSAQKPPERIGSTQLR